MLFILPPSLSFCLFLLVSTPENDTDGYSRNENNGTGYAMICSPQVGQIKTKLLEGSFYMGRKDKISSEVKIIFRGKDQICRTIPRGKAWA